MQPTKMTCNLPPLSPIQSDSNLEQIKIDALAEATKRLRLKFPGRIIQDHQVQIDKIEPTKFSDDSLGTQQSGLSLQIISPGFIISFNYENQLYHLHTTKGAEFLSNNLCLCEYPDKIFHFAVELLSKKITTKPHEIQEEVEVFKVEKNRGTLLSFKECESDLYRYMSQQREEIYFIILIFEGIGYPFHINEEGIPMHQEI